MSRDYALIIRRLLDKAESTDSEAERDALTEKAEHLMVRWGVEAAESAEPGSAAEEIEERTWTVTGPSAHLLVRWVGPPVAHSVCPSVHILRWSGRAARWGAVGRPRDLDRIEMYAPRIMEQARSAWAIYRGQHTYDIASDRDRARRSFLCAFGCQVAQRLDDIFTEETTTGYDLVLAEDDRAAEEYLAAEGIPKARRSSLRSWDNHAAGAGTQAGDEANLSAADVGRTPTAALPEGRLL